MRIAICTGGGDAPGLNAVIRAVVLSARHRGWQSYGIQRGYEGLLSFNGVVPLGSAAVRGITHLGGTILGTTNRGNPFRYVMRDDQGVEYEVDRSDDLVAAFQASGFDALVSIGGDGSLQISHQLWCKGLPVVCVPKTIDNDVSGTQRSFGFDSAVSTATDALDKLHSTAESHDRVMVVELMGRYAGWIALYSGLSGSADVILLPEIPFDMDKICEKIRSREAAGRHFSIVVVAEGARPKDGTVELVERRGVGTVDRLGGIAGKVARTIEHHTGKETRTLV
ncbi:MAG: ATP-dependent 6-phosphofructokinase, partial [Gemmatimonadota bacterium]|nr:ATP-dependent 6-phosphofructokinase [Gemmatimonadota bacterium]